MPGQTKDLDSSTSVPRAAGEDERTNNQIPQLLDGPMNKVVGIQCTVTHEFLQNN